MIADDRDRPSLLYVTGVVLIVLLASVPGSFAKQGGQKELRNFEDVQGFSSSEADLPPLEVRVLDVEGSPEVLKPERDEWSPLNENTTIPQESRIVTLDGESVRMEIPGVSLIKIDTGTEVVLDNLIRNVETQIDRSGLMIDVRKEVTNDVDIEALNGTISNSLRDHENMENDYKIKMPQAVAGVRGTSFSCRTTRDESECSVLEGQIAFSPKDASLSEYLSGGFSASYQQGLRKPDTTAELSEKSRETLEETREQAERELLFEPSLSDFEVNDNSFDSAGENTYRQRIDYYRPRSLSIGGDARAREDGTKLKDVLATVNGESLPVEGLRTWKVTTKPDTLHPGEQRTLKATVTAVDDTGTRSYPETLLVELNHPDPEDVLPEDYRKGPVSVSLNQAGQRSLDAIEYPYHLYRDDRGADDRGTLTFRGSASADSSIQGTAYSTNNGISWHKARGGSAWSFSIPVKEGTKTFEPWLIAWSEDGTIGSIARTGKLIYHDQSLKTHALKRFRNTWKYMTTNRTGELFTLLSDSFEYTTEAGREGGIETFRSLVETLSGNTRNLEIYHRLRNVDVDRDSARFTFDLEVQGKYRPAESRFKLIGTSVTMTMDRTRSGQFRLTGLKGLRHRLYLFNSSPLELASGKGVLFNDFQVRDRGDTVDVRIQQSTVFGETRWVLRTEGSYREGGIFRLNTDNLGEVFPIPERESSLYQEAVRLRPGYLYAVNLGYGESRETVGLLRVKDVGDEAVSVDLMSSLPFLTDDS